MTESSTVFDQTTSTSFMSSPSPRKKVLAIVGALGVIVLIGVGIFLTDGFGNKQAIDDSQLIPTATNSLVPTPQKPIVIETFNNADFTFQYPSNFQVSSGVGLIEDVDGKYIFSVTEMPDLKKPQELFEQHCANQIGTGFCSNMSNGVLPSSVQFEVMGAHYPSIETGVLHDGKVFQISLAASEPGEISAQAKTTYNQILSTFQFKN